MEKQFTATSHITVYVPVAVVWEALTNPEMIKIYLFGANATTDWKIGSPITFTGEWEGKPYEDKGTILEFEPNKRMSYTYWSSRTGDEDMPENYVTVSYTLSGHNGSTHIVATQENIPTQEMKLQCEANWKKVLEGLKKLVES